MEQLFIPKNIRCSFAGGNASLHISLDMNASEFNRIVAFPTHHHTDPPTETKISKQLPMFKLDLSSVKKESLSPTEFSCTHIKSEQIKQEPGLHIKSEPEDPEPCIKCEPEDSEPYIKTEQVDPSEILSTPSSPPPQTARKTVPSSHNTRSRPSQTCDNFSELNRQPHCLTLPTDQTIPRPTEQMITQNLALPAYYLYKQKDWTRLKHYISSTDFHPRDHARLQDLWYLALYDEYRINRGLSSLSPAQKYRIRTKKPIPQTISSVQYKSNKTFSTRAKMLLDWYFEKGPYVSGNDLEVLAAKTELSSQQVKNYFKNKRNRSK